MTQLLKTSSAAKKLDCSTFIVRHSRTTGLLFGRPAPKFIKIGRSVFYSEEVLNQWIQDSGFTYSNTAELAGAK